ncbi:NUDIX domain-containing protein [Candidatus Gracilibacteria bacterium]|nr:NUDIX domain-containing protein [Candidatus Gracilibacteria bacterium]
MPEILNIINIDDQIIGQATREAIYAENHMHRIVHVMVRDIAGRFLFQVRSPTVQFRPLYWSTSAGGHVQAGETYEEAARREMEEEIGVIVGDIREMGTFYYERDGIRKYLGVFEYILDQELNIGEEVSSVEFFSPDEAHALITTHEKIHPELKFLWEKLYLS